MENNLSIILRSHRYFIRPPKAVKLGLPSSSYKRGSEIEREREIDLSKTSRLSGGRICTHVCLRLLSLAH